MKPDSPRRKLNRAAIESLLERIADFVASGQAISPDSFTKLFGLKPKVEKQEDSFDVPFRTYTASFGKRSLLDQGYASDQAGGILVSVEFTDKKILTVDDVERLFGKLQKDPYTGDGRAEFKGDFKRRGKPNRVEVIVILDAPENGVITTINICRG